jgi:hypothetical protein
VLEILLQWPLISKNKIISTNIEAMVVELVGAEDETVRSLAETVIVGKESVFFFLQELTMTEFFSSSRRGLISKSLIGYQKPCGQVILRPLTALLVA